MDLYSELKSVMVEYRELVRSVIPQSEEYDHEYKLFRRKSVELQMWLDLIEGEIGNLYTEIDGLKSQLNNALFVINHNKYIYSKKNENELATTILPVELPASSVTSKVSVGNQTTSSDAKTKHSLLGILNYLKTFNQKKKPIEKSVMDASSWLDGSSNPDNYIEMKSNQIGSDVYQRRMSCGDIICTYHEPKAEENRTTMSERRRVLEKSLSKNIFFKKLFKKIPSRADMISKSCKLPTKRCYSLTKDPISKESSSRILDSRPKSISNKKNFNSKVENTFVSKMPEKNMNVSRSPPSCLNHQITSLTDFEISKSESIISFENSELDYTDNNRIAKKNLEVSSLSSLHICDTPKSTSKLKDSNCAEYTFIATIAETSNRNQHPIRRALKF